MYCNLKAAGRRDSCSGLLHDIYQAHNIHPPPAYQFNLNEIGQSVVEVYNNLKHSSWQF